MSDDRDNLALLREVEKKATPGPWTRMKTSTHLHLATADAVIADFHRCEEADDDLRLVHEMRNAAPAMLAVIEEAQLWHDQVSPFGAVSAGHEDNDEGWCVMCGGAYPCAAVTFEAALSAFREAEIGGEE